METSKEYIIEIGKRIADRRKELGLTQADLGQLLRVTQQEVASYERGGGGHAMLDERYLKGLFFCCQLLTCCDNPALRLHNTDLMCQHDHSSICHE